MAELVIDEPEKVCSKCRETKPATREFFSPKKLGPLGLHSWCKKCAAADRNARRIADPEKNKLAKKRSDEKRKHVRVAYNRRYWIENRAKLTADDKRRRSENGAEYNRQRRDRRQDPVARPTILERERTWSKYHRESRRATFRKLWQSNPKFRLRTRFGNAITDALRRNSKRAGWQAILGYSIDDLRLHLERQFLGGMNWENHGPVWHIDHIVPVAHFIFETVHCSDFKACFALTNLRPLWKGVNLSKRATRTHLL